MNSEGRMTMRDTRSRTTKPVRTLALSAALAVTVLALLAPPVPGLAAQEAGIVGSSMTVSSDVAELQLRTADGDRHTVRFADGTVTVDGEAVGSYEPGGELARAWRDLLAEGLAGGAGFQLDASRLRSWEPPAGGAPDATAEALRSALDRILGDGADDAAEAGTDTGEAVSMTAGGDQLAIAPGRLSVESLLDQLGRLRASLGRLGEDARGAAEDLALVVHDDYALPSDRTVGGNLALLDGELRLGGQVRGHVLVLDGTLILEPRARVDGDVLQVGGEVRREGGRVAGEFLSVELAAPGTDAPAAPGADVEDRIREEVRRSMEDARERHRPGFFARAADNVGDAVGGVLGVVGILLLLGLGGALAVYFVRPQLEVVADTARHSFGRAFGVGLAGQILFGPVLFILVVAVVTWLVIPFYLIATLLAVVGGYLAVAHGAGEALARQRYRYEWMERLRRSNSYYYVLSGLAALLLPFALAEALHLFGGWLGFLQGMLLFVGWVIAWLAASVGLGAVLLSRGGQRRDYARPSPGPGGRPTGAGAGAGAGETS